MKFSESLLWLALLGPLLSFAQPSGWEKAQRSYNGATQRGWARRNTAEYPLSSAGKTAFYADVNAGKLLLSLTNPASVPSGLRGRLSLVLGQLEIEAKGDLSELKVEREDGTPMVGTNNSGLSLQSGIFYSSGPSTNAPYDKQWRFIFSPGVANKALRLTFRQASGTTFVYSLLMPGSASNVTLFGAPVATTTTPPSSTTTAPPSSTTSSGLSFQIVSYSCQTGVLNYRFDSPNAGDIVVSLPGIFAGSVSPGLVKSHTFPSDALTGRAVSGAGVQNGQTVSINFTTSCTLSGTATSPPSTTTTPPSSTTSSPPAGTNWLSFNNDPNLFVNDLATLENSTSKMQIRYSLGGEIAFLGRKDLGNTVCTIQQNDENGNLTWLAGRNWGAAWYMSPKAGEYFEIDGQHIGPGYGIGNDPVLGGSVYFWKNDISQIIKAAIVNDPVRGQVLCMQSRPKQWDFLNKPGHLLVNLEHWWVPGYPDVLASRFKVVIEPRSGTTSPATHFEGMSQEEPSVYVASKFRAPIVTINGVETNLYDTEGVDGMGAIPRKVVPDNRLVGRYLPDLSYGLSFYTPGNNYTTSNRSNPMWGENGGSTDASWGGFDNKMYRNLDIEGWYETLPTYSILGSRATALQRITQLPQPDPSIDVDLSDPTNHSHGWSNSEAPMKNEGGKLSLYIGQGKTDNGQTSYRGAIYSPYGRWAASSIPSIQITGQVTGGASQLGFIWQKADQNGVAQDYLTYFPVIGDGIERTYTVPLTNVPNWNGYICRIGVQATPNTPNGAKFLPKGIKKGD